MEKFICLICGAQIETCVDDDGHVDDCTCGSCHSKYVMEKNNRIVNGKLCGQGGLIRYDYNHHQVAPIHVK